MRDDDTPPAGPQQDVAGARRLVRCECGAEVKQRQRCGACGRRSSRLVAKTMAPALPAPEPPPAPVAKGNDVAAAVRQRLAVVLPKPDAPATRKPWKLGLANKRAREVRLARALCVELDDKEQLARFDLANRTGDAWASTPRKLGIALKFTFDRYKAYGKAYGRHPSTIRPRDATEGQVKAYLKELRKPDKAADARERRATEQARRSEAAEIGDRSDAIRKVLTGHPAGKTITTLMADLAYCKAFQGLTGNSLRKAILRELAKPALAALIAVDREPTKYRQDRVRVRLK